MPSVVTDVPGSYGFGAKNPVDAIGNVLTLALAWSYTEPHRAGEVAVVPPGDPGKPVHWGRERDGQQGGPERLSFGRCRPGLLTQLTGDIRDGAVSHVQLRVQAHGRDVLLIEKVKEAKAPIRLNGQEGTSFRAVAGDVLEVGGAVVLLCVPRPMMLVGSLPYDDFPFGTADRFGIVGESPAAWELRRQIAFMAPRTDPVLLLGESGTGKELVAKAIHDLSARAAGPWVSTNAAAIPETLFEAELFGNLKNYPNPGTPEHPGLLHLAREGTAFLDEIGELPHAAQADLLRVLDPGAEYRRVGEAAARKADVRFIAATNRPESALKHDLAARFILRILIPRLTERREDIMPIAVALLGGIASKNPDLKRQFFDGNRPRLTSSLVRLLVSHPYTTHVREVYRILWDALRDSSVEGRDHIWAPRALRESLLSGAPAAAPAVDPEDLTPDIIRKRFEENDYSIERTWPRLGLRSRDQLKRLLKKHGIEKPPR